MKRMIRPLRFVPATLVVAIALYSFGCGGNTETPPDTSGTPTPTPTPSDTAVVASSEGAAIFKQRCALCHGPDGRGDGPGAKGLKPPPRNYHDHEYMNSMTDEQLLTTIRNGKGAMPAWGKILTEDQMRAVLAHVRQIGTTD